MVKIIFVQERMQMGVTRPFVCIAENGNSYIVKTLGTVPIEQMLAEFIGSVLAEKLDLPIPKLALVQFDRVVHRIIQAEWKPLLTNKTAIGSTYHLSAVTAKTTQVKNEHYLSENEQKTLYMFDRWILNSDRTASLIGTGNINLLFDEKLQKILVIDHNLAFDEQASFNEHIFAPANRVWRLNNEDKQRFTQKATEILADFHLIYQAIPDDWFPLENDEFQKIENHINKIKSLLNRITTVNYWDGIE